MGSGVSLPVLVATTVAMHVAVGSDIDEHVEAILAAAEAVDVPMPSASLIRDHVLAAIGRGMEDLDWSSIARLAAENAGLPRKK